MKILRTIAISDIHGCYNTLLSLLEKIDYNENEDKIIFLGDYIDRGNFPCKVVKFVRSLQERVGEERVVCLLGNHEDFAILENGQWYPLWERNGCSTTLDSYVKDGEYLYYDVQWFKTLPLIHETDENIFCHAGLRFPKLEDNTREDILWDRSWIDWEEESRPKPVIFGHTPDHFTFEPYPTKTGDLCIDCGCVYGGSLCAMIFEEDGVNSFVLEPVHKADIYREPKWTD